VAAKPASTDRVSVTEAALDDLLESLPPASFHLGLNDRVSAGSSLTVGQALELFEDQLRSRALDVAARQMKQSGASYYTISSAGHENNAVLGTILRQTDPAFLHYRSGGFMMSRYRYGRSVDPVLDVLHSLAASSADPIAQGRHKVWGSRQLWVPPQTSTIASHLPKAVGTALAIAPAHRLGTMPEVPGDAIVYCSFGDASANHATALAGVNAARYLNRSGKPVPILFVCEDNGVGISVDTPARWIESTYRRQEHLEYFRASGDLDERWETALQAVDLCRSQRCPVFLHLDVVRLWGHAGSDVETGYRSIAEIEADEARDPLLANARFLVASGAATPGELRELLTFVRAEVQEARERVAGTPTLRSLGEIIAPLAPYDVGQAAAETQATVPEEERRASFGGALPEEGRIPVKRTLGAYINAALHDELLRRPELQIFGEDVGRKGGVYHVTADLQEAFGEERVFDTLLDETTILGLGQGAGLLGLLPVPEIQYLAYVHNALDQLRGEACSLSFFSSGQFTNPMVVRIAGLAYQKGFGGHFHNDNSVGALRDIPGLLLAVPSRGDDAVRMLRGLVATAKACGRVACFLEPIALYHERDLYEQGDGLWLTDYPPPGDGLLPGDVGVFNPEQSDLLIVTYGNGVRMALRASRSLQRDHGVRTRVLDLRWLNPLPHQAVRLHAGACGKVLVADECRWTGGGIADAVVADLAEAGYSGRVASVRSADSYVPLGPAADAVLLDEEAIFAAARKLVDA
jgi:2-oxoisovalerate dehydrogenase E1 component